MRKHLLAKRKILIITTAIVAGSLILTVVTFARRSSKTAENAPRPLDVQVVSVEQRDVPVYS